MNDDTNEQIDHGLWDRWVSLFRITARGALGSLVFGVILGALLVCLNNYGAQSAAEKFGFVDDFAVVLIVTMLMLGAYFVIFGLPSLLLKSRAKAFDVIQLQKKSEELQEKIDEDFFNNLVKINFKYIDKYYLQTQLQAEKAFYTALGAGLIGLGITIAGIIMMFTGKTSPSYVTTGAGVISQFIAAVFFYLYNQTVMHMAEYHRKLVLTQNIGLALRITQDLPHDSRTAAQTQLIERLTADINYLLATERPMLPAASAAPARAPA